MSITILEAPDLGPNSISLRPYQWEAIDAVRAEFAKGRQSTLVILPTGTGKTITFGMVTRKTIAKGGKVLILAHREELIQQADDKLSKLGIVSAIEKASCYARALFEPDCVIATVQTMQKKRLESWSPDYFRLIITDEAHHATAKSYQAIYKHFAPAFHLGVTATADRADEDELSDVFESVAYELSLWDAMRAPPPGPYLCRIKFVQCDVQVDLRSIRTTGGDFNQGDLEEAIKPKIEILANAVRQEIDQRKTLIFTPDVGSGQGMASALSSLGFKAEASWGADPERKRKIAELHAGNIQILCNCALLTEGFDCPDIAAIVLCRPTQSRPLYAQMVGRGTRMAPGKDDCLIVDFDYLTAKHDLVKPVELFDTTHTDVEALACAQELLLKEPGIDLMEAIERGEKISEERKILRIRARERTVKYKKVCYDPMAVFDTMGIPSRHSNPNLVINRATEKQADVLSKMGVDKAETLSKKKASSLIEILFQRRAAGLATMKQVSWLIANGVEPAVARTTKFTDASQMLDRFFQRR